MLSFALAHQLHGDERERRAPLSSSLQENESKSKSRTTQQQQQQPQPHRRTASLFAGAAPPRSTSALLPAMAPTTTTSGKNEDETSNNTDNNNNNNIERGLWIRLLPRGAQHHHQQHQQQEDAEQEEDDVTVQVEQDIPSAQFPHVHPNCNAPSSLRDVRVLSGGGSGTAVFNGSHAEAGSLVLKHGGAKDTLEVFSLVEIASELLYRRKLKRSNNSSVQEPNEEEQLVQIQRRQQAAEFMQKRIPEFVGLFCSPYHFRDRGQEMWSTIRNPESMQKLRSVANLHHPDGSSSSSRRCGAGAGFDDDGSSSSEDEDDAIRDQASEASHRSQGVGMKREISIRRGPKVRVEVTFRNVVLNIPNYEEEGHVIRHGGHEFLHQLASELAEEQQINAWKVTLMQKTIGGPNARNGADILTSGMLRGSLLDIALEEFTTIIGHLQTLTWPDETAGLASARAEWMRLAESKDNVTSISKTTDTFCGSAIRKNFSPETGRFAKLREFGDDFRRRDLMLEPAERFPASFLGSLLKPGANLSDLFFHGAASVSALDRMEDAWLDVLQHASSFGPESSAATNCIWTCGLTDAGLHNTFLSLDRGLELFDLGKPQLMPIPAFMTKFLMSFFHALGMEETVEDQVYSDDVSGKPITWVRRFHIMGGKLALTKETQDLLPLVYEAFGKTLDHFIANIFGNDESVRRLLIKYVVLQLLSDGAFCLLRWEEKGGGRERFGKQAKGTLHKWLWRSLWDLYIASDVYEKLLAPHET